ncbi:MAG: type pilin-related protein [Thermotoga sp.]|jgi:prepilin-type N-terminal cleavage/methylation domain-containing protein|nr:type pilin-related protein [Thermotoga sp.]
MRRRAGFTLIELLIVMAIIATLMAVLTPTATGAMRKARATRIAVQLRNVEQGVEQYLMATLPAPATIDTINNNLKKLKKNLKDLGFVDASVLNDSNLTRLTVDTSGTTKIKIQVEYDAKDDTVAKLAKNTLQETYGSGKKDGSPEGAYVDGTKVGIIKSIYAFWW